MADVKENCMAETDTHVLIWPNLSIHIRKIKFMNQNSGIDRLSLRILKLLKNGPYKDSNRRSSKNGKVR